MVPLWATFVNTVGTGEIALPRQVKVDGCSHIGIYYTDFFLEVKCFFSRGHHFGRRGNFSYGRRETEIGLKGWQSAA